MKISHIETTRVTIPLEAPILWSQGYRSATTRTLVQVYTDDGLCGIGETRGDDGIEEMIQKIAGKLKGADPFQIELILEQFHMLSYFQGYFGLSAIAGVEIALWDIIGKATGQPLCNLLGGRYRDPVPFSGYIFYRSRTADGKGGEKTPEEIVRFCEDAVAKYGFDCLKLKGGAYPPEHDVAVLRAIREHFGEKFRLRIDPNGCWSPQTAIKIANQLDEIGLEYLEDPCWGIEGMSKLRKDIHIPIATNMCVVNFDTLPTGIREGAVDIILADAHKWGGILVTKKLAAVCDAFRIGMSMHSGAELGVSTAVNLHLAASTPQISYSIDGHYHHIVDDIIKGGKHQYVNGAIKVPDGPGLGVELDPDKVKHYHELWQSGVEVAENGKLPGVTNRHFSRSQF